jgi:hypothetical protein
MAPVPNVVGGIFPLDEELGLLPGRLTPRVCESLVRLGTWIPSFAQAARELAWFTGVTISRETARTLTEQAGAAAVTRHEQAVTAWEQGHQEPPPGPETLIFHVDGAMVPLVGGEWAEVKTLVVGEVSATPARRREQPVTTDALTSFSRLTDRTSFGRLALDELQRRGIEQASRVGAVVDGAEWIQPFIDLHYPEAVRILDFPHAAEYVQTIGVSTGQDDATIAQVRHDLKHQGAATVLPTLRGWVRDQAAEDETVQKALSYLEKRVAQMAYPTFQAAGWPIGSGSVESANKLVVEARLKGAGMHWARHNVNPLLALRNTVCNDRWAETWPQIEQQLRQQAVARQQARRSQRQQATIISAPPEPVPEPPTPVPAPPPDPAPTDKPPHPWKRAWSIRRQRELANSA